MDRIRTSLIKKSMIGQSIGLTMTLMAMEILALPLIIEWLS